MSGHRNGKPFDDYMRWWGDIGIGRFKRLAKGRRMYPSGKPLNYDFSKAEPLVGGASEKKVVGVDGTEGRNDG